MRNVNRKNVEFTIRRTVADEIGTVPIANTKRLTFNVFQVRHNRVAADARVPVLRAVPADQTAGDRQHRAPVQARRLDVAVRARRQHRLGRVPGHRARFVAPTGVVPQQELDGEDGGRVTRSSIRRSNRQRTNHWSVYAPTQYARLLLYVFNYKLRLVLR